MKGSWGMDRTQLYESLDRFLAALDAGDPSRAGLADRCLFSENNVMLEPGDGMWNTITGRDPDDLRFADVSKGEVGVFTSIDESGEGALLGLRLKVESGAIVEAEAVVARPAESLTPFLTTDIKPRPEFLDVLSEEERTPRERMIELADGYFATLQLNDGTIRTVFEPGCDRRENGMQTTNIKHPKLAWWSELGCEEQFKLGIYRYDDRLRARRFPLVDEERGIVCAGGFIDHAGKLRKYRLTDGRELDGFFRRPHSFYLLELFKIRGGAIQSIEAVFTTVPYHMPTVW
jgi:hypothetical protein